MKNRSTHWLDRLGEPFGPPLLKVELPFPRWSSGKVREVYDLGEYLLMVASDRISAFDVIMNEGIPGKGILLTQLSRFWFEQLEQWGLVGHHLAPDQDQRLHSIFPEDHGMRRRSMLVRKLKPVPLEAVVRGYLAGSGWAAYRDTGSLFDRPLPAGLTESEALPEPAFTPSTKATSGHDMPLRHEEAARLVGRERFVQIRDLSLALYARARDLANRAGIILADTKFEFGEDERGELVLMDEVFTPDSSRYWPSDRYAPGRSQQSFDKQFVRDFLETCDWNKQPPPPELPPPVIEGTLERYRTAFVRLTSAAEAGHPWRFFAG